MPGEGTNVSGSSALTRHSIEWPVNVTSLCLIESLWPARFKFESNA